MPEKENYNEAVYELQGWLRELHFAGYPISLIIPDGIYDEATRSAVVEFQRYANLDPTGVVNKDTWDALYAEYLKALFKKSRPGPLYPFPEGEGYVLSAGEVSDIVYIVQIMLDTLAAYYDNVFAPITGEYDSETQAAIKNFQRISGITETGFIDKETWNALADAYNKYNNTDT